MAVTEEPSGLNWINNVNMATFGPLVSQICWLVGSLTFTAIAAWLMTRTDYYSAVGAFDANGHRQNVMMPQQELRTLGNMLANILLAAWTGKTIAGVVESQNKRTADPKYAAVLEAKERGKAAGKAGTVVVADPETAKKLVTKEHKVVVVTPPAVEEEEPPEPPPVWKDGRPADAGIL